MANTKHLHNQAGGDAGLARLLDEIEQYFDCKLSDAREAELRREVAFTKLKHPAIDEARALMGIRRQRRRRPVARYVAAAASVAVLIAVVAVFMPKPSVGVDSTCIAYAGGVRVTDEAAVERILSENISDFSENLETADDLLQQGWEDAATVISDYQNDFDFSEI